MKKGDSIAVNEIRSEAGYITSDTTETQRIIRNYCELEYSNLLDILEIKWINS